MIFCCTAEIIFVCIIGGIIHLAVVKSSLDDHPDSYWLTADLLSVDWRKGCLTTSGCAEPRFQITKINSINNEANTISWPITLKLAEEHSHSFISHWTSKSINDIFLKCEVAGLDPTYGFPRICDSTARKRIFDDEHDHLGRPKKKPTTSNGKLVVELKAKCFNASLAVQKYDRCPTCLEHHSIAVVEQYTESEGGSDFLHQLSGNDQFLYALLILSAFTAIITTGFACLLIAFLHQKRRLKVSMSKQRLHSEPLNTINSVQACHDDSRYDVPWEQVPSSYRRPPFRNLSSSRSGFTAISSMPPSLIGAASDNSALTRLDCRKTSPSSSFGIEPHDDSGLESV